MKAGPEGPAMMMLSTLSLSGGIARAKEEYAYR